MQQPQYSIWGHVQDCEEYLPGVFSVGTAGHGGIMVHKSVAGMLSEAAQKRGSKGHGYLQYEEDCDWAIPVYELPQTWKQAFRYSGLPEAQWGIRLRETLSLWNADYLLERGIEPYRAQYERWQERQKIFERR